MPGETTEQYRAFLAYLKLGETRTVDGAFLKIRKTKPGRVHKNKKAPFKYWPWMREFKWRERAAAYDDAQRDMELTALEQCRADWIKRQWDLSQKVAKKAEQMLGAAPAFRREEMIMPDGSRQVIYTPDGWTFNQAMDLAERAIEMGKESLGLEAKPDVVVEHRGPNQIDEARRMMEMARLERPEPESCIDEVKKLYQSGDE